jgi:hypothetical protein
MIVLLFVIDIVNCKMQGWSPCTPLKGLFENSLASSEPLRIFKTSKKDYLSILFESFLESRTFFGALLAVRGSVGG